MNDLLPDPLVPPEVDLRGFPYMPLFVRRLRDSDFVSISSGPEFKAAVMLWCASWAQVPAGSLPGDDRILGKLSDAGRHWRRVREVALYGFVKCSDGRLYHRVIAEQALETWKSKLSELNRTKAATEARKNQRDVDRNVERDDHRDGQRNVHQQNRTEQSIQGASPPVPPSRGLSRPLESPDPPAAGRSSSAFADDRAQSSKSGKKIREPESLVWQGVKGTAGKAAAERAGMLPEWKAEREAIRLSRFKSNGGHR